MTKNLCEVRLDCCCLFLDIGEVRLYGCLLFLDNSKAAYCDKPCDVKLARHPIFHTLLTCLEPPINLHLHLNLLSNVYQSSLADHVFSCNFSLPL
jgi:hypothetical protein